MMKAASYFAVSIFCAAASTALGQNYPLKPLRIITATAGSGVDFGARLIAHGLTEALSQQVIVENRGGIIPAEMVARAAPDGYTLLVAGTVVWIEPLLRERAPYDPVRDFASIILAARTPSVLVVHPSLPVKSVRELITLATSRPGQLNSASGPSGGSPHLAAELFKSMTGVNIVHVSYKAIAQALTGLLGGEVQLAFPTAGAAVPHIKSGRLRALAVTSQQQSALFPDLPTVASTVPGYVSESMTAAFAPAKTPISIVNRLNQEIARLLNQPDIREKFLLSGAEVAGGTPDQLTATVRSEMARMGKVIKDANIRSD